MSLSDSSTRGVMKMSNSVLMLVLTVVLNKLPTTGISMSNGMPLFPDDSLSNYVVKFEVPSTLTSTLNFVFKARVIGRVSGTLPPLTATYYKAAAASGLTPVSITQSYSAVTFDPTAATLASANQAVEVSSSSISVSAGEIIYVKLERDPDATADTYAGEVGVMQQIGVITVS